MSRPRQFAAGYWNWREAQYDPQQTCFLRVGVVLALPGVRAALSAGNGIVARRGSRPTTISTDCPRAAMCKPSPAPRRTKPPICERFTAPAPWICESAAHLEEGLSERLDSVCWLPNYLMPQVRRLAIHTDHFAIFDPQRWLSSVQNSLPTLVESCRRDAM